MIPVWMEKARAVFERHPAPWEYLDIGVVQDANGTDVTELLTSDDQPLDDLGELIADAINHVANQLKSAA